MRTDPIVVLLLVLGACSPSTRTEEPTGHAVLRLAKEKKLSEILAGADHYEASGVVLADGRLRIVFDNLDNVGSVALDLGSGSLGPGRETDSQYEAITYGGGQLFVGQEGTKGTIIEVDAAGAFQQQEDTNLTFGNANKGLEGLAFIDATHLLALGETNGGKVDVLAKAGDHWTSEATLLVPVAFDDYSDVALLPAGDGSFTMAVLSQDSSMVWIGRLASQPFRIDGAGTVYDLPRDTDGKKRYCAAEGVTFLDPTTLAMVSDKSSIERCKDEDESVHVFVIP